MKTLLRMLTVLALLILGGLWITPGIFAASSPSPTPPTVTPTRVAQPTPTVVLSSPMPPTVTPTRVVQPTPTVTPRPVTTPAPTPTTDKTGYTLVTSLSADPKNSDYAASFLSEVSAIYAWAFVVAEGGAAEKQFLLDIQFTSPMGSKVDSKWYGSDTSRITSVSRASYDAGKWEAKNVARRQLDIAGTGNADLTGQWTVTFSVSGKVVHTENFMLATAEEITAFTKEDAARKELEDKGYTVKEFVSSKWDDGTIYAFVRMPMVSKNVYSSETSQQLVDGFTADRKGFPSATLLMVMLEYTERYWIRFDIKTTDWDAYVKSKDFNKFVDSLWYAIWDIEKRAWVPKAESKDFMNKNFGAGSVQPPSGVTPKKGTVGAVRVQVSPSTLLADGTSTAQVIATVYDKQNKPVPDTTLTFAVSGTGMGTIQPKTVTTDSKGQAKTTYKAGTKAGTVTITASVGNTSGTTTLTLGEEEDVDTAEDNVRTFLAGQGYKVLHIEYNKTEAYVWVLLDLGEDFDTEDLVWAVLYGCATLRDNYPNATKLGVAVLYERMYGLVFPLKAADVDQVVAAVKAAKGDKIKINAALKRFFTLAFNNAVVIDVRTGKVVGTVKDFTGISFGF